LRRRYPRLATNVTVSLALSPEGPEGPAEVTAHDLGMGGVAVFSPRPLLPGTRLHLEFQVEGQGNGDRVRARGEVRWSRLGAPPVLMGVEFLQIENGREALQGWLERQSATA
jgi:hypothetical protein